MRFSLLIFILTFFQISHAQNWNVGSGGNPARNGQSSEVGPETETILWQGGLSATIAQQAVIEGDVVVMSRILSLGDVLEGTTIVAHNLEDGTIMWTQSLPVVFPSSDWRNRVSAIRDGQVYATRSGNTNKSFMYALDATNGDEIWRSESLIDESSTESCSFAENGDLIVGNNRSILRIDKNNGGTIWETPRTTPTSNGQEVAVHGELGYFWQPSPFGPTITVIDIESGGIIHETEAITPGLVQQLTPLVGPDGTVFAPRTANNPVTDSMVALTFEGDSLIRKWSVPIGYVPFSTSAVNSLGWLYTYGRNGEVICIDESGEVIYRSEIILTGTSSSPRMAIDANDNVFVTNGEFDEGAFYAFDLKLNTLWSTPIRRVNIGGPAIGKNGTLVICGVGTDVRAYKGQPTSVHDPVIPTANIYPNPVQDHCLIQLQLDGLQEVSFDIYNVQGQLVRALPRMHQFASSLNLSFLKKGTYLVKVIQKDQVVGQSQLIKL